MTRALATKPRCSCAEPAAGSVPCLACQAQGKRLLRRASGPLPAASPRAAGPVLDSPGLPLEAEVRSRMERSFGQDFSGVRIHADSGAAMSAVALRAEAWSMGHHIAFARGRYAPGTPAGDRLLAHELAHVVQQGQGHLARAPEAALERDAETAATRAVSGLPALVRERSAPMLARQPTGGSGPVQTLTPEIEQELIRRLHEVRVTEPFERRAKDGTVTTLPALEAGPGHHRIRTIAVAAVMKPDGTVSYLSAHFDSGMDEHAEPQLLAKLRQETKQGDYTVIAIDQVPCPPGRANCMGELMEYREDPARGSLRVTTLRALRRDVPPGTTRANAKPEQLVSPKTAVQRDLGEQHLREDTRYRRRRLPLYTGPDPGEAPSKAGTSPGGSPPAAAGAGAPPPPAAPQAAPGAARPVAVRAQPPSVSELGGGGTPSARNWQGKAMRAGAGSLMEVALQDINFIAQALNDRYQRQQVELYIQQSLPGIREASRSKPGLGVLVELHFSRPGVDPDSAIRPGDRFDYGYWSQAERPNPKVGKWDLLPNGWSSSVSYIWIPPRSGAAPVQEGEQRTEARRIASAEAWVAFVADLGMSDLDVLLALRRTEALSMGDQTVSVGGQRLAIPVSLHTSLVEVYATRAREKAEQANQRLREQIGAAQQRIDGFMQEGRLKRFFSRGERLTGHELDDARFGLAKAEAELRNGNLEEARNWSRRGRDALEVAHRKLYLYEHDEPMPGVQ